MDQFRIAADSSCNLLALDGADFVSVPLTIRTDAEEFRDDASLDVDAMVAALRATKGRSYSACPNIAQWEEAFGERGDVIAFTITSGLSGSYNAACAAKEICRQRDPSRRIHVVDSLSAGPEIALLIEKALSETRAGADFDGVFLIDAVTGLHLPGEIRPLIHGDALSYMIGAASIIAKVTRDRYMIELDAKYPMYGFARNKGYGTAEHIAALKKYGPCPEHRRSFIAGILGEKK